MRLLLDTHVFLWWRSDSPNLRSEVKGAIANADSVLVSAASAWEVAIKLGLGKLRIPGPLEPAVEESGFIKLAVTFQHAAVVQTLPNHHHDPFDRMLIAQALVEGLTIVTHDRNFRSYQVPVLWT